MASGISRGHTSLTRKSVKHVPKGRIKDGAKTKTYSIQIKTGGQERLMEFQKTPEFKAKERERYKTEAKMLS